MSSNLSFQSIAVYPHHLKTNVCGIRASYRDGRKPTAVKAYTINEESNYLLVCNVPSVGASEELYSSCRRHGNVDEFKVLDDYPGQVFTDTYLVKFRFFLSARSAKKRLDDSSFLGGILHVCYAPEFESVSDTRLKFHDRKKTVHWLIHGTLDGCEESPDDPPEPEQTPEPEPCEEPCKKPRLEQHYMQPLTYVWAGVEYSFVPEVPEPGKLPSKVLQKLPPKLLPRQLLGKSPAHHFTFGDTTQSMVFGTKFMAPEADESGSSSYQDTVSHVRAEVSKVSVPNVRTSVNRRKRI